MTPADVDNKVLLVEADDLALANGTPVSPWPDTSGAAHDLATAVSAERPTCRTDVWSGHRVVRFVASGLDVGHKLRAAFVLNQPVSVIVAFIPRGFQPDQGKANGIVDGTSDFTLYLGMSSSALGFHPALFCGASGFSSSAGRAIGLHVPTVLTAVANGANSVLEHDGVDQRGPADAGSLSPTGGITLGANGLAAVGLYSEFSTIDVFGLLACSDVWTRAERLGLLDYFVRKYGLDLGMTTAGVRRTARAHRF